MPRCGCAAHQFPFAALDAAAVGGRGCRRGLAAAGLSDSRGGALPLLQLRGRDANSLSTGRPMSNRILNVDVQTHRLNFAEAEIWVVVTAERVTRTTEVRGRFVGPKSAQSSTVEVAYPLRPFPHKPQHLPDLALRV